MVRILQRQMLFSSTTRETDWATMSPGLSTQKPFREVVVMLIVTVIHTYKISLSSTLTKCHCHPHLQNVTVIHTYKMSMSSTVTNVNVIHTYKMPMSSTLTKCQCHLHLQNVIVIYTYKISLSSSKTKHQAHVNCPTSIFSTYYCPTLYSHLGEQNVLVYF